MSSRDFFSISLLVIILGGIGYWYFTRPGPQEACVINFFEELSRGNAEDADDYLVDESYAQFLKNSIIRDSDGVDLKEAWGEREDHLEDLARTHIPFIKGHIRRLDFVSMDTQYVRSKPNEASVHFNLQFNVKEALDAPSIPGNVEGIAEVRLINGKWVIEKGQFDIRIIGRSIKNYVETY